MPFRYAPYIFVAMIGLSILAFWPGYFSVLSTAPWGFHFHGIIATLWMVALALQSWSIHARKRSLHRTIGIGSLVFFPVFLAGAVAVVLSMAHATPNDIFYQMYGARLGIMDAISPFVIAWLYYHALSERRSIQLHARYFVAIPLFLAMPICVRLVSHLTPALQIHGKQDFDFFATSMRIANGISLMAPIALYATSPRHGRPFLIAGVVMLVQSVAFDTLGRTNAWHSIFVALGNLPMAPTLLAVVIAGGALSWFGWINGIAPARKRQPLAAS